MPAQVPRLQAVVRDRRANWAQSIATLEAAKASGPSTEMQPGIQDTHHACSAMHALHLLSFVTWQHQSCMCVGPFAPRQAQGYRTSIASLDLQDAGARVTKTSIMLGCGEQPDEVLEAMRLLRASGAPHHLMQRCG